MTDKPRVAWISTVDQADATGDVADAYAVCDAKKTGQVDHIMKVHSLHPRSMLDHEQLYRTLMYGPSPLKRPQREMIATVVSALNHCVY
jgi:alkylhydroperoxidase family enzyme